jgi:hypothetical protein
VPSPSDVLSLLRDNSEGVQKALRNLAKTRVLVGIPSTKDTRPGEPIGNATLGYIHERGSPVRNIPARPWLEPGIKESQQQWEGYLKQAGQAALEGNEPRMNRALNAAGLAAVTGVKNRMVAGIPPPLAQSTVDARRRLTKGRRATMASDTTPLIDTGQLIGSITYVVSKKSDGTT